MNDLSDIGTVSRLVLIGVLTLVTGSCSIGRRLTPQSDIEAYEIGIESSEIKILVAARDSEFKVAVAGKVAAALAGEGVYVKFIGVDRLKDEDASSWSAVIVMTTCIAWGLDSATEAFLERSDGPNVVVMITSGAGDWMPDMEGREFDAVTSASVMEDAGPVAGEIVEKVRAVIAAGGSGA